MLALNHYLITSEGRFYFAIRFGAPVFFFLSAGALIHPPLMTSLSQHTDAGWLTKVLAMALCLSGLAAGLGLSFHYEI